MSFLLILHLLLAVCLNIIQFFLMGDCHFVDVTLVLFLFLVHLLLVIVVNLVDLCLLRLDLGFLLASNIFSTGKLITKHNDVPLLALVNQTLTVVFRVKRADLLVVHAHLFQTTRLVLN